MSSTLRRLAGTAALALVAGALSVPFAPAASAVVLPDRVWSVYDANGDDSYGLYYSDGTGGQKTPAQGDGESSTRTVFSLSSSRDGSRVIYMRYTYLPAVDDVKQEVVVRDTSTQVVRVLESRLISTGVYPDVPALSQDGTKAVWESYDDATGQYSVRKAMVGSGAASTLVGGDLTPYAFLDNDTVLIQTPEGVPYTIPFAGGTKTAVTGLDQDAIHVTVSPDGTKLAWALVTGTSPSRSTLQVAPLTLNSGVASVGAATNLDTTLYNRQPAFSRDGSTVYYLKTDGTAGGTGDVWYVPAAGGTTTQLATTADDIDVAVTNNPGADAAAPGDATANAAFTIAGTTATVRWSLPTDTDGDLSGVLISREGRSTPLYVPAPSGSVVDTGLVVGQTYHYSIKAVDRSGNQSATAATRTLQAIAPGAYFGDPTSKYSTKTSFPVRFATGDPGTATYVVKYLPYGGTLKTWVNGATGATRTFGVAGNGGTVANTTALAGGSYKFAVTVTDAFGNSSAPTVSGQAVVPFDQSKAVFNLSSSVASGAAYLGSFKRLSSTSAYAKVSLVGDRLQVIGFRCPSCGSFAIYDGATKVGTVSTYSSSTIARAVLFTKAYAANGTHTFTIRPLGTAGHPTVALDGLAMRRK